MSEHEQGSVADIVNYKLGRADEDFLAAKQLYDLKSYRAANNRAYYAVFHAVNAVLAKESTAFKKHKDVIAYFNKNYIHTGKFPKEVGKRIHELEEIRHERDYSDFYIASKEEAKNQIDSAEYIIKLIKEACRN